MVPARQAQQEGCSQVRLVENKSSSLLTVGIVDVAIVVRRRRSSLISSLKLNWKEMWAGLRYRNGDTHFIADKRASHVTSISVSVARERAVRNELSPGDRLGQFRYV